MNGSGGTLNKIAYPPAPAATSRLPAAAWAVLAAAAVGYVVAFTANAPWADEWEFVSAVTAREPIPAWLWRSHNEHRLPLPRLVYLAAFRLTHDYRAGNLLQVVILSAAAFAFLRTAARVRGRPVWQDCVYPLVLLHWGHYENWLMSYQLCFALVAGLAAAAACLAVKPGPFPAGKYGVVLLLLAACGAMGLIFAATGLPALLNAAVRAGRTRRAAAAYALAFAIVAYGGICVFAHERPTAHPPPPGVAATAAVAGQVLALGFGLGVGPAWPAAAAAVLLGTAVAFAKMRGRMPGEFAVRGLLVGGVAVAAAVGVGRAGLGNEMGLWSRYGFLAAPLVCVAALVGGKWVSRGFAVVAVIALPANTKLGSDAGTGFAARAAAFERDFRARVPTGELLDNHVLHPDYQFHARPGIPWLMSWDVGPFAAPDAPPNYRMYVALGCVVLIAFVILWRLRPPPAFRFTPAEWAARVREAVPPPRGLTWAAVTPDGDPVPAGGVVLVPIIAEFEPVLGSDMEDVPAARDPRPAVAVFARRGRQWAATGRLVFNMNIQTVAAKITP